MDISDLDLVADGWYKVTGRGWAAAIINENDSQLPPEIELRALLNKFVRVDGRERYVVGVETQGYSRKNFGLLIRGEK